MNDVLMAAVVFSGIALVFKIIADGITRNKLINKGMVDENIKYLFKDYARIQPLNNIKWGFILLGIGLALILKQILPFYVADESVFGLMFIFAGAGFLTYYLVADKRMKDKNQN